jgi:hypothetical protein
MAIVSDISAGVVMLWLRLIDLTRLCKKYTHVLPGTGPE